MPRSSRHKSHKQHKHKDVREQSDSDEDVNLKGEGSVRVSRDSVSSEKRKLVSLSTTDSKHLLSGSGGGGGGGSGGGGSLDLLVNYGSSKRRKERGVDGPVSDRWNGGDKEMKEVVGVVVDLEKGVKLPKVSVDSTKTSSSKSSRRHESLMSERKLLENVGLVIESEEIKKTSSSSSKIDSNKWKMEKDMGSRKEVHHQYKDVKDKEHGLERDNKKAQDVKRESSSSKIDTVAGPVKREVENAEGQTRDGQRNPELEKELDKRIRRRRDDSVDKDKYQDDIRDVKDSRLSTRDDRTKNGRYKDEKYKDEKYKDEKYKDERYKDEKYKDERYKDEKYKDERYKDERYKDDKYKDKYHEDFHKDHRNRDDKHQDDLHKDHRNRDDKHLEDLHKDHRSREDKHQEDLHKDHRNRDDKRRDDYSRDHTGHRSDTKHSRDDNRTLEIHHKKSKPLDRDRDRDGSPRLDDQASSYRDSRGRKRASDDNDDHSGFKSRSTKEQRYVDEKRTMSSSKIEPLSDRGKSESRPTDLDSSISRSRQKSSPSTSARYVKDQYRSSSKQAEPRYKDTLSDERVRPNATPSRERAGVSGVPERVSESRSMEKLSSTKKPTQEDEHNLVEFSAERSPISEARASPLQLNEKSHSSTSIDKRYSNRTPVRRNLDVEETGRRTSGSKDVKDYSGNEDRGSRERPLEKPAAEEFSQVDGDTVSVSSSFNRTSHFPSNSSSFPPPAHPSRMVGSPSVLGPSEEDNRGKSNNRYRRNGDFNVGRGQGNAWKGVPNWPSPLANGFIPFQHGPPPGGFHAMMQQFPAPPLFGIRSSMDLNHNGVPYHITDADRFSAHGRPFGWQNSVDEGCPPHMHGWDGSTGAFGDESHMYGRPDWDQNRHMMNGRGWEANAEMWKGQNNSVNLELTTALEKDDHLARTSSDEVWAGQPGQRSRNERSRPGFRPESIEIKRSNDSPPAKSSKEAPIKRTREKTPEPSTKLSTDASFCHVYLSKLDISVDLTHPELYNQCMALFDIEGNSTGDAMKPVHPEDPREARLRISDTTLSASFFPTIKDTLLQRAMSLYKKQGELMKGKHPASSIPGLEPESSPTNNYGRADQFPTPNAIADEPEPLPVVDGYNLEPISTSASVIAEESVQTSNHEIVEETVLTSNHEKGEEPVLTAEEPVTAPDLEKHEANIIAEEPVSIPDEEKVERVVTVEEPVPNPDEEKAMEPVLIPDEEKVKEPVPTPDEEKVEESVPILDEVFLPAEPPVPIPDEVKPGEPVPIPDEVKEEGPFLIPDEEKAQEAVPILVPEMVEKSTPNFCQEVEDPVLNSETEKPEELVPASHHQDMEVVMAIDLEKSEETVKDQSPHQDSSQVNTIAPTNKEDVMIISSDSEGNGNEPASIFKEQKVVNTSDHTICGPPLGFTNNTSEVCEALMPESIEYSSSLVNLSRIHHSPESTH